MEGAYLLSFELSESHNSISDFGIGPVHMDKRMRSVSLIKVCCEERKIKVSDVHTKDHILHQ